MYLNLAIIGAFIFLYSILSGKLERTPINGAIVFTAFGFIFGSLGLGLLKLNIDSEMVGVLAELTLAMVLFIDASNANLGVLKKSSHIPQRLLVIALPLIILLGFGVGYFLFDNLTLLEIAILATMLAPTDAALGKVVVTNKSVPVDIREGLNVESGLNDGICVPILFIFLALATSSGVEGGTSTLALKLISQQIGIGVAVGALMAIFGAWITKICGNRGWITETWRQLIVVSLA
ncbi:MAG: cation:proton antiporter domain-containing protein, partial [Planctomycetota bacterium]